MDMKLNTTGIRPRRAEALRLCVLSLLWLISTTRGDEPTGRLLPQDAAALMEVTSALQHMEREALTDHTEYTQAVRQAEAARAELASHRAAFEAVRNADSSYASLKQEVERLQDEATGMEDRLAAALSARRSSEAAAAASRSALQALAPRIARLEKQLAQQQKLLDHLLTDLDDDVGTNQSGSRANSVGMMQERVAKIQSELSGLTAQADAARTQLLESQSKSESLASQVAEARTAQQQHGLKTKDATLALTHADREWEAQYHADPKTSPLRERTDAAEAAVQQARVSALTTLSSDAQYAQLAHRRDEIERRRIPR